jgi:hypothetical protein
VHLHRWLAVAMAFAAYHATAAQPAQGGGKPALVSAAGAPVAGVYSDLKYIREAGDLVGREIFIVFGGDFGYFAVIQCAEGWPGRPVLVAAKVEGSESS